MYKYTRQEAADKLGMSTRTIDRYVKSGKIRAKKEGKIIYLNSEDLSNLDSNSRDTQEVIVNKEVSSFKRVPISNNSVGAELDKVYLDMRNDIRDKDSLITELSIRVGQAEEIVKNSVSLLEFKKSQLLLEESRTNLNQAIVDLETEKEELEKEIKSQRTNNIILLVMVVMLFAIAGTIFFLKI